MCLAVLRWRWRRGSRWVARARPDFRPSRGGVGLTPPASSTGDSSNCLGTPPYHRATSVPCHSDSDSLSFSLSLSDPPSLRTHTRTLFLPRLTRALTLALPPSLCSRDVPIRADSARLTRTVEINKHKVDFQHTRHALDGAALRASRACVGFHRCSRIYGKGPEDWKGGMDLGALVAGEQTGEPGRRSSGVIG